MVDQQSGRNIDIGRDASGSLVITGDQNSVTIYLAPENQGAEAYQVRDTQQPEQLGPNPYKSLTSFKESDATRYFGREEEVKKLWQRFRELYELSTPGSLSPRVLSVLGPSGCGKSSLVRAGLIPELARQPWPSKERIRVAVIFPGSHPTESLAKAVLGIKAQAANSTLDQLSIATIRQEIREIVKPNKQGIYDGIRLAIDSLSGIKDSPLVLVIDQFEELYSLCQDLEERQVFLENLFVAASDPNRHLSVIFTLRSDFLGEAQRSHSTLNKVLSENNVLVPVMSPDGLREAIVKPAENAGFHFSSSLVSLLIEQTKGREALPLLQFSLTKIWDGLLSGQDPAETLEQIGGVGGALAQEAQRIYDNFNESEKAIAFRIFSDLVVPFEVSTQTTYVRKPMDIQKMLASTDDPAVFQRVIDRLSQPETRFITVSSDKDHHTQKQANVTHEALCEQWKELKEWLQSSQNIIQEKQKIEFDASEWEKADKIRDYLPRGKKLVDLQTFQTKHHQNFPLSITATEYLKRGRRSQANKKIRDCSLVTAGLAVISLAAGFSWLQTRHQEAEAEILRATLDSQPQEALLPTAKRLLGEAKRLERRQDIEQALEYYRKLMLYSSNAVEVNPIEDACEPTNQSFAGIYCSAQKHLIQVVEEYRLSVLEQQIKNDEIGEVVGSQISAREEQFSEGALKTTYAILMSEYGIGADYSGEGKLSASEADTIPCALLKRLEEIWAEQTEQKCNWIDKASTSIFRNKDCESLNQKSLLQSIFGEIDDESTYFMLEQLKSCQIIPAEVIF